MEDKGDANSSGLGSEMLQPGLVDNGFARRRLYGCRDDLVVSRIFKWTQNPSTAKQIARRKVSVGKLHAGLVWPVLEPQQQMIQLLAGCGARHVVDCQRPTPGCLVACYHVQVAVYDELMGGRQPAEILEARPFLNLLQK
jgi:hypothetical protein